MKKIIVDFLFIVNVISYIVVIVLGFISFVYAIISPIIVEKIFGLFKIPWDFKYFCYFCIVFVIVLFASSFLRKKIN